MGRVRYTLAGVVLILALGFVSGRGNAQNSPGVQDPPGVVDKAGLLDKAEARRLATSYIGGDLVAAEKLRVHGPAVVPLIEDLFAEHERALVRLVSAIVVDDLDRAMREEVGLLYRGQFAHLAPLGSPAVRALLATFGNEDTPQPLRARAAHAIGDFSLEDEPRKEVLDTLRTITRDFLSEPWFEVEAGYLMARLGDRSYVEPLIARWDEVTKEQPSTGNLGALITAHQELSEVHYRIGDYESAIRHYHQREVLILDLLERVTPQLRRSLDAQLALLRYNVACSYSLAGRFAEARANLESALPHADVTPDMIGIDGDLRGLRETPEFPEWIARMKAQYLRPVPEPGLSEPAPARDGVGESDTEPDDSSD